MKKDKKDHDDYFEIKKIKLKEFEEVESKQKASLLRRDIALGVISVLTSTVFAMKGYNPFLAFIELFTLPIGLMVLSNIKILTKLKQEKARIINESELVERYQKNNKRGK